MLKGSGRKAGSVRLLAIIAILMAAFAANTYAQYNGQCWAADYYNIYKIERSGELIQIQGLSQPLSLSINSSDGSCWVADTDAIVVRKISAAGEQLAELNSTSNPPAFASNPRSVSVYPKDGSCWVAVFDKIYKYSADAKELFKLGGFDEPYVAVNSANGECWVADSNKVRVLKYSPDGKKLSETQTVGKPGSPTVNPKDGSCWVLDTDNHKALKFSPAGKILVEASLAPPTGIMASTCLAASNDGGCWAAIMVDMMNDQVLKLSADGKQVLKVEGFSMPSCLAFDPYDGGCWVADTNMMDTANVGGRVVKLSSSGKRVIDIPGFTQPKAVAVAYPIK